MSEIEERLQFAVEIAREAGDGTLTITDTDPIDWVLPPTHLQHVRDGYGVIIAGDSMVPIYRPGDIALVNPRLPPKLEDVVILYTPDKTSATIKEYRGGSDLVDRTGRDDGWRGIRSRVSCRKTGDGSQRRQCRPSCDPCSIR